MSPDPLEMYGDIIHLPRPRSARHAPMPIRERAAQFSAFAALSGHSEAIQETARLTDARSLLSDAAMAELDEALQQLLRRPGGGVRITRFVPDQRKSGGAYRTICGTWKRLDEARRLLVLADGSAVPLADIVKLENLEE